MFCMQMINGEIMRSLNVLSLQGQKVTSETGTKHNTAADGDGVNALTGLTQLSEASEAHLLLTKGPHIQRELNLEQAAVLLLCCRFTVPAVSVKTFTFLLTSTTGRRRRENFLSDSEDVCIEMLKKTFLIQMLFREDAASAEPSPHRLCQCYQ